MSTEQYWEDGYLQAPPGSKSELGLYGLSGGPKDPTDKTWTIFVFSRHLCLFGSVPEDVKKEVCADPKEQGKALIIDTMDNMEKQLQFVQTKYEDVDHEAVFKDNSERLHAEAERITGKKIPRRF